MKETVIGCVAIFLLVIALSFLWGWLFMLLWNWLAPLFWASAPILTYWQSFGIIILVSFLGRLIFGRRTNVKDN